MSVSPLPLVLDDSPIRLSEPGRVGARRAAGEVVAVDPAGPAAIAGVRAGDRLLAVNGQPVRDIIDVRFYGAEPRVTLEIEREGQVRRLRARNPYLVELGLEFADPLFDRLRTCNNKCPFCFLKGLPKGLRQSLYIKDDDYRLAFLYGNFATLTNLRDADWERISEQHLSPLYVSVHAVDPSLRRVLLDNPRAPEILPQLDRLAAQGIRVHTQLVLCPGLNDGAALDESLAELGRRYPYVESIGVVPVGLTEGHTHLNAPGMRPFTREEADAIVTRVRAWERRFRRTEGVGLVYASDEFYLLAERPVPSGRRYDGYPQYENGIGMVRSLLDDWARVKRRLEREGTDLSPRHPEGTRPRKGRGSRSSLPLSERAGVRASPADALPILLVTGRLAAPILGPIAAELGPLLGRSVRLAVAPNRLFGEMVTVAGLLAAADLAAAVRAAGPGPWAAVAVPRTALDTPGQRFLDDVTPAELSAELGVPIIPANTIGELVRKLR